MGNGFDDIIDDHRQVDQLLEQYRATGDDGLAREACMQIALHAEAEEQVLYPYLRRLGSGEGEADAPTDGLALADRAEAEHAAVGAQIAHVLAAPPIDLAEPMAQITDEVRAHVAFEEAEVLPRLRPLVDAEELHRALTEVKERIESREGEPLF